MKGAPNRSFGNTVEVVSGPLRGLQGVIVSRLSRNRVVLQIDLLGRVVRVEIDAALLRGDGVSSGYARPGNRLRYPGTEQVPRRPSNASYRRMRGHGTAWRRSRPDPPAAQS